MKLVKYHKKLLIENPTMLACWPGMGNVAFQAIDYIRKKLSALPFAEIDLSNIISPDAIVVNNGISSLPKTPPVSLYFSKKPPLIISVGKVQSYGEANVIIMENLLDVAQQYNVKLIISGAAFPMNISYRDESKVYAVANKNSILNWLKKEKALEVMKDGQISGLNGLLLGFAGKKNLDAACLLATMPLYAINIPNPKASLAIVKILMRLLDINIDLTDLELSLHEMEKTLDEIEKGLLALKPERYNTKQEPPKTHLEDIPASIINKIEKLFEEAKKDKKTAARLKEELDRWNLFKMYEDRFLDLFHKKGDTFTQ